MLLALLILVPGREGGANPASLPFDAVRCNMGGVVPSNDDCEAFAAATAARFELEADDESGGPRGGALNLPPGGGGAIIPPPAPGGGGVPAAERGPPFGGGGVDVGVEPASEPAFLFTQRFRSSS